MAEQAAKEPTMEEILSSIRRIISDGGDETANAEPDTGALTLKWRLKAISTFPILLLIMSNRKTMASI